MSRYPRPGEPIVPRLIGKLLKEAGANGFDDLGSTAWSRLGVAECRRRAQRVLSQVGLLGPAFFARFADQPLSRHEATVPVGQLELEGRTRNCLAKRKLDAVPTGPNGLTLGDVLGINGFGSRCLVDFAASLEAAIAKQSGRKRPAAAGRHKSNHPIDNVRCTEGDAVLAMLAAIPGALAVTPRDPRLGSQLQSAAPGISTLGEALDVFRRVGLRPAAARAMERLLKTIRTMPRAKVEEEVLAVMTAGHGRRDRELIAACLEWREGGRPTYRSVGKRFGITYERVRQVFCKWQKAWVKDPPFAPVLDRALAVVQAAPPAWAADVERQLAAAGLCSESLSLERLRDFARLLSREPGFVLFGSRSRRSVASAADARTVLRLQRRARKLASNQGLANVAQVAASGRGAPNLSECLSHALRALPDFAWIDEAEGTFSRIRPKRNKVWTRIRKVLSVAPRVKLDVLWDAVRRDPRFPTAHMSKQQLLGFCRRHPECRVVGTTVIARHPQSPSEVFRGDEQTLVNFLLQRGPLSKRELFQLAREAGMGKPSFERSLTNPAIRQLAVGVYGIVGGHVAPARISAPPR